MAKGICVFALLAAALGFVLNQGAEAQANGCAGGYGINIWHWPNPIPPGWICTLPGEGPWSMFCYTPTSNTCPPVYWCPTCGGGGAAAGRPINLANGNTYIQETDVKVPGLGGGLSLQRTWNSMWPTGYSINLQIGIFGSGWRSTYEERVFPGSGNAAGYMMYSRSDGGLWFFTSNGTSTWTPASPANVTATLTQNGTTSWTLAFQSGEQRTFSYASGSLVSITDRNGNTTQLTYDGTNRLTTVTDPVSRHLYFNYTGSSTVVSSVTSDLGLSLSYTYDTQGRLSQVTYPDNVTTVSFTYNGQGLIALVTDSQGKTLESHTYDAHGRGLTSSRANGVEALTVSYPN